LSEENCKEINYVVKYTNNVYKVMLLQRTNGPRKTKNFIKKPKKERYYFTKHAELQMMIREDTKERVTKQILNPTNLIDFEKQPENKYKLIFNISNSKTMVLPIIFERKGLKVITYIMRYRSWKKIVEKGYGKKWKK